MWDISYCSVDKEEELVGGTRTSSVWTSKTIVKGVMIRKIYETWEKIVSSFDEATL